MPKEVIAYEQNKTKTRKSRQDSKLASGKSSQKPKHAPLTSQKKSKKAIRAYRIPVEVKGVWAKKIKKMLGIG